MNHKTKSIGILLAPRNYYTTYVDWILSFVSKNPSKCRISYIYIPFDFFDKNYISWAHTWIYLSSVNDVINNSDLVISLGHTEKLSKEDIDKVPLGIINIHHSYKMKYRGRHTCTWAIRHNEEYHGSSIHYMNENIDDGPIIATDKIKIDPNDTSESLFNKVNLLGLDLLKETLPQILNGSITYKNGIPPDPTPYYFRERDLCHEIDYKLLNDPLTLYNHIRSLTFNGAPKPYITINNQKIELNLL